MLNATVCLDFIEAGGISNPVNNDMATGGQWSICLTTIHNWMEMAEFVSKKSKAKAEYYTKG